MRARRLQPRAVDVPIWLPSSTSDLMLSGWEQHVFVHIPGKVIFSSARFWSRSAPSDGRKRKTENARWSSLSGPLMDDIRWPGGDREEQYRQSLFEVDSSFLFVRATLCDKGQQTRGSSERAGRELGLC